MPPPTPPAIGAIDDPEGESGLDGDVAEAEGPPFDADGPVYEDEGSVVEEEVFVDADEMLVGKLDVFTDESVGLVDGACVLAEGPGSGDEVTPCVDIQQSGWIWDSGNNTYRYERTKLHCLHCWPWGIGCWAASNNTVDTGIERGHVSRTVARAGNISARAVKPIDIRAITANGTLCQEKAQDASGVLQKPRSWDFLTSLSC